jgi:protein gp37
MVPEWVRSIRDQCVATGVPFFFKQWGELCDWDQLPPDIARELDACDSAGFEVGDAPIRVGKKAAGRLLDGQVWDQRPEGWG